jgi:hypothetical protein
MKFYMKLAAGIGLLILAIWLLQEYGGGSSTPAPVTTAATTPAPAPQPVETPAPTVAPPAPTRATLPPFIQQSANGAHVKLVNAVQTNGWWLITVQGRERNALNEFLDVAQRQGLRDLDVNYPNSYREFMQGTEQAVQGTYKMRF